MPPSDILHSPQRDKDKNICLCTCLYVLFYNCATILFCSSQNIDFVLVMSRSIK